MANEKRLIDANALLEKLSRMIDYCKNDSKVNGLTALSQVGDAIMDCPTVDAVEVPCKIGDFVWAIRNFKGHKHPQRGIVSDMFFNMRMELIIVVAYVARGEWGKTVFATDKEAYAAIGERRTE